MRMLRDSVAEVTMTLKKQKNKGRMPLVCAVPLRGCGFEIIKMIEIKFKIETKFPSPCGDVVLKSLRLGALCGADFAFIIA